MTFLGIELDTIAMEARLPLDNVLKIKNSLSEMRVGRKITLRVVLPLKWSITSNQAAMYNRLSLFSLI
jgi:hypothetical protein